jgi:hypothetical protein
VEKYLDPNLDESLESDVDRNVEQIMDEDSSNSENGTDMEQTEDPMSMTDSSRSSNSYTESTSPNAEVR